MEWFKHKTNGHDDPVVSDAWDKFGDAGYVIWFVLLELYGQNFKTSEPKRKLIVSKTFMRRKFRKSWGKVEKVLNFYSTFDKLSYFIVDSMVHIEIPKFHEILSNWTSRMVCLPTEGPTEAPTAKSKIKSKSKSKSKIKKGENAVIFPDWIDKNLWSEFKKYRLEIKSPLTDHAEKLCLSDLVKLVDKGENQKAVINQTIKSGKWKTFYPENKNFKNEPESLEQWKSQFSRK